MNFSTMHFRIESKNHLDFLFFRAFEQLPSIRHALFLRLDADKSLPSDARFSEAGFLERAGLPAETLVTLHQVHGSSCIHATRNNASLVNSSSGDCLIASEPGIAIAVRTADCFPVLVANMREKVVSCVHAGWRGIARGVIETSLEKMANDFSCTSEDAYVALGPGIEKCCYEVKEDTIDFFKSFHVNIERFIKRSQNNAYFLSLSEIIADKLLNAGVHDDRIVRTGSCTFCSDLKLPSFRRDGKRSQRTLSAIMLV